MIIHRLFPICLLLSVLSAAAISVFEDTVRIKFTTAMLGQMKAGGPKLKSTKRPIIGSNGIFWAVHLARASWGTGGTVCLWISKKEKVKASGMHYVGPATPGQWPITANFNGTTTEIMVDDGFSNWRLGPHGYVEVSVIFSNFEPNGLYVPSSIFKDTIKVYASSDTIRNLRDDQIDQIMSSMRPIVGSTGIFWAVLLTRGRVRLWISKKEKVNANGKYYLGPAKPYDTTYTANFETTTIIEIDDGYNIARLGPNGFVKVDVTFTNFKQGGYFVPATINDFIREPNRYETDAKIDVYGKTLHVHRHLLSIISPVFQAELMRYTEEAEPSNIQITGFSYTTVKNAIDFCYGRDPVLTVLDCVDLLRFANKYKIWTITNLFESAMPIAVNTFSVIAQYAWEFNRKVLQRECAEFYKDNAAQTGMARVFTAMSQSNQNDIIRTASLLGRPDVVGTAAEQDQPFARLFKVPKPSMNIFISTTNHSDTDAQLIVNGQRLNVHRHYLSLISPVFYEKFKGNKAAALQIDDFSFTTVESVIDYCYGRQPTLDMLNNINAFARFGHKYRIPKVIQLAKPFFFAQLTTSTFSSVAQYAWEFENTDLKTKCAVFYRNNHADLQFRSDFINLGPPVIADIIRRAASVK